MFSVMKKCPWWKKKRKTVGGESTRESVHWHSSSQNGTIRGSRSAPGSPSWGQLLSSVHLASAASEGSLTMKTDKQHHTPRYSAWNAASQSAMAAIRKLSSPGGSHSRHSPKFSCLLTWCLGDPLYGLEVIVCSLWPHVVKGEREREWTQVPLLTRALIPSGAPPLWPQLTPITSCGALYKVTGVEPSIKVTGQKFLELTKHHSNSCHEPLDLNQPILWPPYWVKYPPYYPPNQS